MECGPIIPNFAVLAFAKEDRTVRLLVTSSTKPSVSLLSWGQHVMANAAMGHVMAATDF